MTSEQPTENTTLLATPSKAPVPVAEFMTLTAAQQASRSAAMSEKVPPGACSIPIRIGLFFDGTNNNLARDRNGELISGKDKNARAEGGNVPLAPEKRSHSNVARLSLAYATTKRSQGIFSYYIPGVGTRFHEIEEYNETPDGKAFAKGGEARIIFALLEVINSIHLVLTEGDLFPPEKAGAKAKNYERTIGGDTNPGRDPTKPHISFFAEYIDTLSRLIKQKPKPVIPSLTLDVFGFSRGGAEAVAFCHMFNDLLKSGCLASIPATINFLGVFDVVASVGVSFSVALTTPVFSADGHFAWAKRILDPLPPSVRAGRHFVAAHEQRMNFPVTTQFGSSQFKQYYFPGVHSDVGGGYGPDEGGKARGGQGNLLSQIPLAYMYHEGLTEGVAFKKFDDLDESVKADFEISPGLASAWEGYCKALRASGEDHGDRLKTHMSLFYRWRKARLNDLESAEFYKLASKQSQQDYSEANQALKGDLEIIRSRSRLIGVADIDSQDAQFDAGGARASQWQILRRRDLLSDWEKWALAIFDKGSPLPPEVISFFDNYVHDSLAGFYLAGEVTDYDKQEKVASVFKERPEKLKGFDKKIFDHVQKAKAAAKKQREGLELTAEEKKLAEEHAAGTPFPVMTDEDTKSMRSFAIKTQTSTRREGGGYLLPRFYFPRQWTWLLQKQYKYQKELDREASVIRHQKLMRHEQTTDLA